ncbi:MAG TPA: alkaline phosphatase family protein [Ktedonobacteraceae bacterium]|nr:alkaline phosphatase family protein [Ktedonobacteraceae bacterium]
MTRVVMLGIDGLDADLLRVYGPSLPHLRRLMLESPFLELTSSFPPEAAPAWTSIYSGLNPARHGLVGSAQVRADGLWEQAVAPERLIPRGQTFWDRASEVGKRVCILNLCYAYPAWPVNGVMLSLPPVGSVGREQSVVPAETPLSAAFPPALDSAVALRKHELALFCQSLTERCEQQALLGLELFTREPWDLFFLQLDALSAVQRLLWRYSDPGDPAYPGPGEFADTILDFYRLFDQIIGRFRSSIEQDCVLVVVSGYGQGRGCVSSLHLNEWLRFQGLLTPQTAASRLFDGRFLRERVQSGTWALLTHLHMQEMISRRAYYQPRQQINDAIDRQETLAYVVEFAGRSPFGGIVINRAKAEREGDGYERLRAELLLKLARLRVLGQPVVHWARAREEYYRGESIESYPDILFELRSAYHVSGDLYTPLVTPNMVHPVVSGNNRMYGVLLLGNLPAGCDIVDSSAGPDVMDVAPTVLHLLDVTSAGSDGQALVFPAAASPVQPLLSLPQRL